MTNTIELEPVPLSVKRFLGLFLLSIALILSISTVTDKRITLNTSHSSIKLKSIGTPVYAEAVPEILVPVKAPEPISEPKPAEVVQVPPLVIEAPVEPPKAVEKPKPVVHPKPVGDAKAFIYMHESGNNPHSKNKSSGACGLGQALPCSKMPCAMGDYICQDAFFTEYMQNRYGSWENARAFWISHSWW